MSGHHLDYRHSLPQGYDEDNGRPSKRARSGGLGSDSAPAGISEEPAPASEYARPLRQDSMAPPRAQEKDKNRRLSCKECRRLKLKCDRVFPCQSCVKRGCGSLCPEGALTSGRGSRFILANTEQLHEKITQLSDRVRQLEDALGSLQSTCSNQPHPLLSPELLRVKTSQDLYITPSSTQPGPSEPALGPKDDPLGESVVPLPSSHISNGVVSTSQGYSYPPHRERPPPEVPPDILQLSSTFPFPWMVDLKIRKRIRDSLPPRNEALAICEEAQKNALWQYNMDASETFLQNLLHHCYTTSIEDLSPRRLALLLMILSIGSLVDLRQPLGSLHGEAYHHLARASVCEIPLMEEPDFDVLHALFFMIWYHLIFSDNKKAVGYAWNLMGFVAKLAQGLGLHRENSRLKGIPEEDEKRRAVFWELLNLDCRMSLSLGRPPSICLSHVDTKPPSYNGSGLYVPREQIIYHEWKNAFFIQCLTPALEATVAVDSPSYSRFITLDKSIRDFNIPTLLDEKYTHSANPRFLVMQRALVSTGRDIALLQLHRRFFTEAMNGPEPFDLHHQYAPSVLATYIGAASLISAIETLFDQEEQLSARFLHFWFNSFSAAVTLSLFISRAPSTPLAPYAIQDLDRVCRLFRRAAKILPFSGKALPVMEKLTDKSRRSFMQNRPSPTPDNPSQQLTHPQSTGGLPTSFSDAHPTLVGYAEKLRLTNPGRIPDLPPAPINTYRQSHYRTTADPQGSESWLPDIYAFNSAGVGVEERYVLPQPTPFTPSSPRVAENESFNFDHGAFTFDLAETSYMAWF
ncbi:hypothetical protein BDZ94DRAFT_1214127 [Collybia nuda]|uniref:Zn(2)-C6 fungal-type domain-containing protein n=1 Tax=Collybia nuda TaxID=64659 RepID=A0A9P5YBD5_9AGAR|nr:hypothetical protein BDZ94DRAFT_1214127 [Collybia nuda]